MNNLKDNNDTFYNKEQNTYIEDNNYSYYDDDKNVMEEQNREYEKCLLEDVLKQQEKENQLFEIELLKQISLETWETERRRKEDLVIDYIDLKEDEVITIAFVYKDLPQQQKQRIMKCFSKQSTIKEVLDFAESRAFLPPLSSTITVIPYPSMELRRNEEQKTLQNYGWNNNMVLHVHVLF
jgi:hypothetical protein